INGGSSSIKYALFELDGSLRRILDGGIERIGLPEDTLRLTSVMNPSVNFSRSVETPDYRMAVSTLVDWIDKRSSFEALTAIGHRVCRRPVPTCVTCSTVKRKTCGHLMRSRCFAGNA
ncbi:MAG: hypothetical protein WCK00_16615, partial [Deltaproteobacteria bacterium]